MAGRIECHVVATGEMHTVREFCERAFSCAQMPLSWSGSGIEEKGMDASGKVRVEVDPGYFRPAEVELLLGNPAKAKALLGWEPSVGFDGLIKMMVLADLEKARQEVAVMAPVL